MRKVKPVSIKILPFPILNIMSNSVDLLVSHLTQNFTDGWKMKTIDILILGPEILLIIYSIIAILTASFLKSNNSYNLIFQATVIIFLISALILYFTPFEIQTNVNGIFVRDTFSKFFQILILLSVSCLLFMSKQYLQKRL